MLLKRIWEITFTPFAEYGIIEEVIDRPEGYGVSHFWYCAYCGETYAKAIIPNTRWRAINGCCNNCSGNRWTIPGSLESLLTVGWAVPEGVVRYQLICELRFLDNPHHPYNEKENKNV